MPPTTHLEVRPDGVAVITLDNPPVNSLASGLVKSFNSHLTEAKSDSSVKALVVTGKGSLFCGGFAIEEFATAGPEAVVNLHNMINSLDAFPKPCVAALNGQALGGGCEVSLGCHYRVAAENCMMGTPEVLLGLLPGGQGTQRLPRLAPLEVALGMVITGAPLNMAKAKKAGLVDVVVPRKTNVNVVDAAAEFALNLKGKTRPVSKIPMTVGNKVKATAGGLDMAQLQASKAARG